MSSRRPMRGRWISSKLREILAVGGASVACCGRRFGKAERVFYYPALGEIVSGTRAEQAARQLLGTSRQAASGDHRGEQFPVRSVARFEEAASVPSGLERLTHTPPLPCALVRGVASCGLRQCDRPAERVMPGSLEYR